MARAGLVMLPLGINGAVLLILDVALGGVLPFVLSGVTTLFSVLVWGIYPLSVRERPGG